MTWLGTAQLNQPGSRALKLVFTGLGNFLSYPSNYIFANYLAKKAKIINSRIFPPVVLTIKTNPNIESRSKLGLKLPIDKNQACCCKDIVTG